MHLTSCFFAVPQLKSLDLIFLIILAHAIPGLTFANLDPRQPSTLTTWEQIHQTLHTYPLAVDGKQSDLFPAVFTQDVQANYTGTLANVTGLPALRSALLESVSTLVTQHQLGTILINISDDQKTANSTTYFTATLWSVAPATQGQFTILFGLYSDTLVLLDQGWRINNRDLVFMTPSLGNLTMR